MNLVDDIKILVKEYGKPMLPDHRFLNMLHDIHDFRHETKTFVLLKALYNNGAIGAICACSKENIKETIDAVVIQTHLTQPDFEQKEIERILYSYAIAIDILSQSEVEECVSSAPICPKPIRHKKEDSPARYDITTCIYLLLVIMAFTTTTFAVSAITIVHCQKWNVLASLFIILGDFLFYGALCLCAASIKPRSISDIGLAAMVASLLVVGLKSLIPFFYHDIEAFEATMLILNSLWGCGLGIVGFYTDEQYIHSVKYAISFVGTFLILSFISIAGIWLLYTEYNIN